MEDVSQRKSGDLLIRASFKQDILFNLRERLISLIRRLEIQDIARQNGFIKNDDFIKELVNDTIGTL